MDKTRSVKYPQITEADYVGKLVSELDDRPQMLPGELKSRFDALGKDVIIPVLNSIAENIEKDFDTMNETIDTTFGYTCKNLLPNEGVSKTQNGVTFTVNADGSVTANGTASNNVIFDICPSITLQTDCILNGCPSGGSSSKYLLTAKLGDSTYIADVGESVIVQANTYRIYIVIYNGQVCDNLTFYPMLRKASIEDPTYEPYKEPVSERLKSCLLIVSFDAETGALVTKSMDYEG